MSKWVWSFLAALSALAAGPEQAPAATTLDKVRAARSLNCGVNVEENEYTMADAHGNRAPFDQDFCKAVALAVLGPNAKFVVKPFRDEAGSVKALQAGDVDLVASGSTYIRNTNGSLIAGKPIFYDYQGFLVNKALGIHSAKDLVGKKTCFLIGTEIEAQVDAYMARQKIHYIPGPFSEEGEMEAALVTTNCAAVTADATQLAYERIAFRKMAAQFDILPDVVTLDPLAPLTRSGDAQWSAIVDWTLEALIQAEEFGITQGNLEEMKKCEDVPTRRLLGTLKGWAQYLGLDDDFAAREISGVGNYGEMFERDLGPHSPMRLERGVNKLWIQGGMMWADPIR